MRSLRELARFATRANSAYIAAAAPAALSRARPFTMSAPAAVDVDAYKVRETRNPKFPPDPSS
jgi:hypothetical protein